MTRGISLESGFSISDLPEVGQVVRVRERHYQVTEVVPSWLPHDASASILDPGNHLVALSCVEDDGMGEELRVIWEIEPGAESREVRRLPDVKDFDEPRVFDAFLNAVRWGAISSADRRRMQSPFRAGITVEDYQLEPLARAIEMPRANLLIADDVGLGKTIEAGLIALELMLRHRAHRMLIVCPANLTIQWREQMQEKFGLPFEIVDRAYFRDQRRRRGVHVNPWSTHPRMIVSIDFLKQERVKRLLKDTFPDSPYPRPIDLLIVDEAANVAPSSGGKYQRPSERTRVIREIAPRAEHRLFLTATPHNGYRESFTALLELVDDQRFVRGVNWDQRQLERVMIRRMKSELTDPFGRPRFHRRQVIPIEVAFTEEDRRIHRLLSEYAELRRVGITERKEEYATQFVLTLLKKRLFSSPAAFARTLARHRETVERPKRRERIGVRSSVLQERLRQLENDVAEGDEFEEQLDSTLEETGQQLRPLGERERQILGELEKWAEGARDRPDVKATKLIEWLEQELRPDGNWNDKRVIVFTEYRDTLDYLRTLLAAHGLKGNRVEELTGSTSEEDRERIKREFQYSPTKTPVRILLATDSVSEGLDFQFHCSRLIHYEIPWNPNRLEQRNGRIDRHGQKETPKVFHFVPSDFQQSRIQFDDRSTLEDDLEFLARAIEKVENIRDDLGSYGDVIAEQVRRAMLGDQSASLEIEDNSTSSQRADAVREALQANRNIRERLQQLSNQISATERELHLSPEHVQNVVEVALQTFHQPPLSKIELSDGSPAFHVGQLTEGWAYCTRGLTDIVTEERRPITFDRDRAGDMEVVLAHLQHPLVERSLSLLRAEIWSRQASIHRVTARVVDDQRLQEPVVVAHGRIVVTGADGKRLHEEVISTACAQRGDRLSRLNVGQTREALESATDTTIPAALQRRLADLWNVHREQLEAALQTRLTEVQDGIRRQLSEQLTREQRDIEQRLSELARQIQMELDKASKPQQLTLDFSGEERDQFQRDLDAIRGRLERIPADIASEQAALARRYSITEPHLFPVAVEYLIPRKAINQISGV